MGVTAGGVARWLLRAAHRPTRRLPCGEEEDEGDEEETEEEDGAAVDCGVYPGGAGRRRCSLVSGMGAHWFDPGTRYGMSPSTVNLTQVPSGVTK